ICYAYKGQSNLSLQKLDHFIEQLRISRSKIWNTLNKENIKECKLSLFQIAELKVIVEEIFCY
ncbi:MAG: hypothetical protein ACFE9L_21900, partial [Candidatus Hodarchaeota archaeon]